MMIQYASRYYKRHSLPPKKTQKRQKGMTLVELMVGSLIGMFLLTGMYKIYIASKKTIIYQKEQSSLQNKAQFAFSFIATKLQQAGDFGCSSINGKLTSTSLINTTDQTFRPWRVIEGWEASATNTGNAITLNENATVSVVSSKNNDTYQLSSNWITSTQDNASLDTSVQAVRNSDILKIWYTDTEVGKITAINGDDITISTMDLNKGDIVVLNDCETILMAQVCACDANDTNASTGAEQACKGTDHNINVSSSCTDLSPGNKAGNTNILNLSTADARQLKKIIFYVSKQGYEANNPPALYWKELSNDASAGTATALLENVENIQFLYGEDIDNDASPNYYVSADKISSWTNVVSIKVNLLLRSYTEILSSEKAITFNGIATTPPTGDHYLRYNFSTTIALRNKLLAN